VDVFHKIVVANRAAAAARVLRAVTALRVRAVAVYSDADAGAPHLDLADEAYRIGAPPPRESYLNEDALLDVVRRTRADGLHPGYGFLSENHRFAQRVEAAGARFIGPSPRWIEAMGHKTRARDLAGRHGLPVGRGSAVLAPDRAAVVSAAAAIGYPVLVKPACGGGGIGMLPARNPEELLKAVERAASMAARGFASAEVYLERLLERPRHVEIQVLGDREGRVAHLFERDCSVQRRHQKVIEEAPGPGLERETIKRLSARVAGTLERLGYDNIGTVEMLLHDGEFSFLEMNTRLQVEHAVTEAVTGVDLVVAQVRAAAGHPLSRILAGPVAVRGHAIEARVYAEDPWRFLPSPGTLALFRPPEGEGIRVETGYREGQEVTPHYDPLLAKVIVHAPSRERALGRLVEALEGFAIGGVKSNLPALLAVLRSDEFRAGRVHTGLAADVVGRAAGRP
jgi:acetyl-CoA carboxylase biotin carboxylase subunit